MTITSSRSRVRPGVREGGQYAAKEHAETGLALAVPAGPFSDEAYEDAGRLLDDLYDAARRLMDEHGLQDWSLAYSAGRGRRLGSTEHVHRLISLSAHHMVAMGGAERRDTVLHEIAHALLPADAQHGPRWQAKAREVGASPRRVSDVGPELAASAAVVGRCPEGHLFRRGKMPPRGSKQACASPDHLHAPLAERTISWSRNAADPAVEAAIARHPAPGPQFVPRQGQQVRVVAPGHHLDGLLGVVVSVARTRAVVKVEGYPRPVRSHCAVFQPV